MNRSISIVLLLACSLMTHAGEVLDRTVAMVNGRVILLSDWNDELHIESLMQDRKISEMNADDKKSVLDHLIDQELLREQMRTAESKPVAPEKVARQLGAVKEGVLRAHVGQKWEAILSQYGLSEKLVSDHVAAELQALEFIGARFRPSVQVMPAEIEEYYKNELVPKLPPSDPVNLSEVAPKIREILVQKKIDQMLATWLQGLRSQAQIRILSGPAASSSSQGAAQ